MYALISLLTAIVLLLSGLCAYLFHCLLASEPEKERIKSEMYGYRDKWLDMIKSDSDNQFTIDDLKAENESLKRAIKNAQSLLCSAAIGEQVDSNRSSESEKPAMRPLSPKQIGVEFQMVMPPPPPQGEPMAYV